MSSWFLEEVANAQLEVAKQALQKPCDIAPYQYFLQAMELIRPKSGWSFLDAGCGTSGYGLLCAQHYSGLAYTGTDASEFMVCRAEQLYPKGKFEVREFNQNDFGAYDIALVSSVLEYAGTWSALEKVLKSFKRYVILHRMRGTNEPSHTFRELTYCGHSEDFYLWNHKALREFIGRHASLRHELVWEDGMQMTLVVGR